MIIQFVFCPVAAPSTGSNIESKPFRDSNIFFVIKIVSTVFGEVQSRSFSCSADCSATSTGSKCKCKPTHTHSNTPKKFHQNGFGLLRRSSVIKACTKEFQNYNYKNQLSIGFTCRGVTIFFFFINIGFRITYKL